MWEILDQLNHQFKNTREDKKTFKKMSKSILKM